MQHADISSGEEAESQDASFAEHSESREKLDEFDLVYGKQLQSPILGHHYQLLDLPTSCIPSTILDTSLLHIPVYAHLKVYDVKPVRLPEPPSILSALQLQLSEGTALSKSPREMPSTARLSEDDGVSGSCSARNTVKITNKKRRV
ncbi:PREDICTED: uncharacterized protein LOC105563986 isoform X2 [Vollenhovia emeryi]|uniref:uncharacterized protein LOC105563986 isoform X2 n=1 Tax=Vollenhovia emeryi TaxID=411798 RepID=UPI0005F55B52|nr:PREDICTED: uncharacterized protein LOC105563986 isoform X2 [Vollenhovia emeryi]